MYIYIPRARIYIYMYICLYTYIYEYMYICIYNVTAFFYLSLPYQIRYKTTLYGRVHVLVTQTKTSLLLICTHTVISKLEHCTKSQW